MKRHFISLLGSMSIIAFAAANEGGGGSASGMSIADALNKLSADNNDDWTEAGLPSMARMKELTGNSELTRAEVGEAKPGFNRGALTDKVKSPADNLGAKGDHDGNGKVGGAKPAPGTSGSLEADAAEKKRQADEANAETARREKPAEGAAEALEGDKERPAEATAGNVDHTSSTQHDARQAERKGDDFGLDAKDDDTDNIPEDNRGRPFTEVDVQAVGLQEKLSPEEAQAATAAALAGDDNGQSDYDRGFIRGYELGKTEGAKGATEAAATTVSEAGEAGNGPRGADEREAARQQETAYMTREQRNVVDPDQPFSAATASDKKADIGAIVEAAGGDAIALCEALVQAAAGDRYKRNSALGSFVRGYMVSQGEIREVQRRLDLRNDLRAEESRKSALKA